MNIAGLSKKLPFDAPASFKDLNKGNGKSPFASILSKVNEDQSAPSIMKRDTSTGELTHPLVQEVKKILTEGEQVELEKIEELLVQLLEQGILQQTLGTEMLQSNETMSLLELLPEDFVARVESLFENHVPIQELMFSVGEQPSLENLLASFIYLSSESEKQGMKDVPQTLLPFFNHVTSQLSKIEGGLNSLLNDEQLAKDLENFLSKFHTKLTGTQTLSIETNSTKLDYVKALYQRTVTADDVKNKNNTVQDSAAKTMFMGVDSTNSMNRVQQFALFIEQHASKPVNQEQFIKDFQNLLARSTMQKGTDGMRLLIKLYPEQLGQLRIELIQQQGVLVARMIASSTSAKELLESQLQGLKNAFVNQNIQVEKLEIISSATLGHQQFERSFERDSNGQQYTGREKKNEDDSKGHTGSTFEDAFIEELMNIEE